MTESTKRPRRTFSDEFKNQIVQLSLNGKRKTDIIKEYDLAPSVLDKWINQSQTTGSFHEKYNRTPEENASNICFFEDQVKELKEKVKPDDYQRIPINGYIILDGEFNPDAIISYKTPRKKTNYGIDTYPEHLQQQYIKKLHDEHKLKKEHMSYINKYVKSLNLEIIEYEKQFEFISQLLKL